MPWPSVYDNIPDVTTGQTITAAQGNLQSDAINALQQNLGLWPAGGYATATQAFAGKGEITAIQNDAYVYAVDTGTASAYAVTISPAPAGYAAGMRIVFKAANANSGPVTLSVNGLPAQTIIKFGNVPLAVGDINANQTVTVVYDGTKFQIPAIPSLSTPIIGELGGRLTVTSMVPVTTSDVTSSENVYFTPYKSDRIALFDGGSWSILTFTETPPLSLIGLAPASNYDVFAYNNGGTVAIELSNPWSSNTVRTDAISLTDGIYLKSADTTRRWLGTIRTIGGGGATADSATQRFCLNYYNKVPKSLFNASATGASTTSGTYVSSGVQVEYLTDGEQFVTLDGGAMTAISAVGPYPIISIGATTSSKSPSATACGGGPASTVSPLGYNAVRLQEGNVAGYYIRYLIFRAAAHSSTSCELIGTVGGDSPGVWIGGEVYV